MIDDFQAWEVRSGVLAINTSHFTFKGLDLIATRTDDPLGQPKDAVILSNNASDMVPDNTLIDGFRHDYNFTDFFTESVNPEPGDKQFIIVGGEETNIRDDVFRQEDWADRTTLIDPGDITERTPEVDVSVTAIGAKKHLIYFEGTRLDSLGEGPLELGTGRYLLKTNDIRQIIHKDGYFEVDGKFVAVVPSFDQDRLTGELIKVGHIAESANNGILNSSHFAGAEFKGTLPADNAPPIAGDDAASTCERSLVVINLLSNDSDTVTEELRVDGFVQPRYGKVVDNGDGSATYTPNADFVGDDTFEYWVSDGFGHFTKGYATVTVQEGQDPNPPEEPRDNTGGGHDHGGSDDGGGAGTGGDDTDGDGSHDDGSGHDSSDMGDDGSSGTGGDGTGSDSSGSGMDHDASDAGGDDSETTNSEGKSGLAKLFDKIVSFLKSLFGGASDDAELPAITTETTSEAEQSPHDLMAHLPTVLVDEGDSELVDGEEPEEIQFF